MIFVSKEIARKAIKELREKNDKRNAAEMKKLVDNYEVKWID